MGHQTIDPLHGHWLLAKLGKRVLRPGGRGLTEELVECLNIKTSDKIIEFAPGLGSTASLLMTKKPENYVGIEINAEAVEKLNYKFQKKNMRFINESAVHTGLSSGAYDKVLGEAMLTMRADPRKLEIIREAFRLLKPGGVYGIHELGLVPDDISENAVQEIKRELELTIKVNASPLTKKGWIRLLEKEGFKVNEVREAPMRLLDPQRIIEDEGITRAFKIGYNIMSHPKERGRVLQMRKVFRKYKNHLKAFAFIATK